MQQAIQDSQKMNAIQLIILGVEGGLFGLASVVIIWLVTSRVVARRLAIFRVFLAVPSGVVRSLATAAYALEEGSAQQDETLEVRGQWPSLLPSCLRDGVSCWGVAVFTCKVPVHVHVTTCAVPMLFCNHSLKRTTLIKLPVMVTWSLDLAATKQRLK